MERIVSLPLHALKRGLQRCRASPRIQPPCGWLALTAVGSAPGALGLPPYG